MVRPLAGAPHAAWAAAAAAFRRAWEAAAGSRASRKDDPA